MAEDRAGLSATPTIWFISQTSKGIIDLLVLRVATHERCSRSVTSDSRHHNSEPNNDLLRAVLTQPFFTLSRYHSYGLSVFMNPSTHQFLSLSRQTHRFRKTSHHGNSRQGFRASPVPTTDLTGPDDPEKT